MYGIMNDSEIEINGARIRRKEYKGQAVVTLADIDGAHGRPAGTAGRNFRKNRKHFIEGEDFFKITPDEFRRTIGSMDLRQQNDIILLTESGYLMIVKSFNDELSWKVQRQLVNTYFRVNQITTTSDNAILLQIIENQMSLEHKMDNLQKGIKISNEKINTLEREIKTLDKKVDSHADNVIKTLFDMSSNVISKGMQIIYNKLSK